MKRVYRKGARSTRLTRLIFHLKRTCIPRPCLLPSCKVHSRRLAERKALNDVTFKLTNLLGMIFDKALFAYPADKNNTKNPNFLKLIVNHEAGRDPRTNAIIAADAMVDRFTTDLWKIAQDGGLTLNDKHLSDALTAFVMQKYYDETQSSAGYNKTLFTRRHRWHPVRHAGRCGHRYCRQRLCRLHASFSNSITPRSTLTVTR